MRFLKGIGGYFEITLPLNIPLTQEDRFFSKVIACLSSFIIYLKNAKAFFKFYKFYKFYQTELNLKKGIGCGEWI
ncbi:hypothetical protein B0X29_07695 [Helicobacter pylori]|nr:hypothetical protein B0X29_07695 [Helicobacter pylori]